MKNEYNRKDSDIRRILLEMPESKHRKLRLYKAMFDKTWNELLVDFYIALMDEMFEHGKVAMVKLMGKELKKK